MIHYLSIFFFTEIERVETSTVLILLLVLRCVFVFPKRNQVTFYVGIQLREAEMGNIWSAQVMCFKVCGSYICTSF